MVTIYRKYTPSRSRNSKSTSSKLQKSSSTDSARQARREEVAAEMRRKLRSEQKAGKGVKAAVFTKGQREEIRKEVSQRPTPQTEGLKKINNVPVIDKTVKAGTYLGYNTYAGQRVLQAQDVRARSQTYAERLRNESQNNIQAQRIANYESKQVSKADTEAYIKSLMDQGVPRGQAEQAVRTGDVPLKTDKGYLLLSPGLAGKITKEKKELTRAEIKEQIIDQAGETPFREKIGVSGYAGLLEKKYGSEATKKIEDWAASTKWGKKKTASYDKSVTEYADYLSKKQADLISKYPNLPESKQTEIQKEWGKAYSEEQKNKATGLKKIGYNIITGYEKATKKVQEIKVPFTGTNVKGYFTQSSKGWEDIANRIEGRASKVKAEKGTFKSQYKGALNIAESLARTTSSTQRFIAEKPLKAGAAAAIGVPLGAGLAAVGSLGSIGAATVFTGGAVLGGAYAISVGEKLLETPTKQGKYDVLTEEAITLYGLGKGMKLGSKGYTKFSENVKKNLADLEYTRALNKRLKNQLVVKEDLPPELLNRDLGVEIAVKPVESFIGVKKSVKTPSGKRSYEGELQFKLGKEQLIKPDELPSYDALVFKGERLTSQFTGKRGDIVGKSQSLIKPTELTKSSGQFNQLKEPFLQYAKADRFFELLKEPQLKVSTSPEGVSISKLKFTPDKIRIIKRGLIKGEKVPYNFREIEVLKGTVEPLELNYNFNKGVVLRGSKAASGGKPEPEIMEILGIDTGYKPSGVLRYDAPKGYLMGKQIKTYELSSGTGTDVYVFTGARIKNPLMRLWSPKSSESVKGFKTEPKIKPSIKKVPSLKDFAEVSIIGSGQNLILKTKVKTQTRPLSRIQKLALSRFKTNQQTRSVSASAYKQVSKQSLKQDVTLNKPSVKQESKIKQDVFYKQRPYNLKSLTLSKSRTNLRSRTLSRVVTGIVSRIGQQSFSAQVVEADIISASKAATGQAQSVSQGQSQGQSKTIQESFYRPPKLPRRTFKEFQEVIQPKEVKIDLPDLDGGGGLFFDYEGKKKIKTKRGYAYSLVGLAVGKYLPKVPKDYVGSGLGVRLRAKE